MITRWLLNNKGLVILIILDTVLFHSLISFDYKAYWDYTTIPYFIKLSPTYIFNSMIGITQNVGTPFNIVFSPGLMLVFTLFLLLGNLGIGLYYFLYILSYSVGVYYLTKTLSNDDMISLMGGLIGTINPGVMNIIVDTPGALYLAFLPWFIGLYYRYRSLRKKKYLYALSFPLALSSVYGPTIVALGISVISLETYFLVRNRTRIREEVFVAGKAILSTVLFFLLSHFNAIFDINYTVNMLMDYSIPPKIPGFNIVDVLTYNTALGYQRVFQNVSTILFGNAYLEIFNYLLIAYSVLCIISLLNRKVEGIFPLTFLILSLGVMSYSSNYLGLYSLFQSIFPILTHVNPAEYTVLLSIFYSVSTAYLKELLNFPYRLLLPVMVILLVIISIIPMSLFLNSMWTPVTVPQEFIQTYNSLNGLVLFVPSVYAINFNYYPYVNSDEQFPIWFTVTFFSMYPNYSIVPVPPIPKQPYYQLVYSLYAGNKTEFMQLAMESGLKYVVWFNSSTYKNYDVRFAFLSKELSLQELINTTGFNIYKSIGRQVVILQSPYQVNLSLEERPFGFLIQFNNHSSFITTPLVYRNDYILFSNGELVNDKGFLAVKTNGSSVFITSWYAIINLLNEIVVVVLLILTALLIFRKRKND
ncbi:hypothetical protein [Sulfolobus acidocaldarius]|uniref:Membrane protein n=2 Tax=Sulfolobus acidocaldarius TaxID=2285 RepID=Q4J7M2_SULAC|nr:hypothetical protein [Sulfolobus acidocaldarius]AAY81209.1 membrane protein [Sulfolobus acidocaldarius DSM 639]